MMSQDEPPSPETEWVPGYPRWVRALAVLHVLSLVLAPGVFFMCAVATAILVARRGQINRDVVALAGVGIACPAVGSIYRGWFERWGRRNYPPPASED